MGPTLLLAALNLRIMLVYRRSCDRRRRMTLCRSASSDHDDPRHFAEERRLVLLLGSTSILFLVSSSAVIHISIVIHKIQLLIGLSQSFGKCKIREAYRNETDYCTLTKEKPTGKVSRCNPCSSHNCAESFDFKV